MSEHSAAASGEAIPPISDRDMLQLSLSLSASLSRLYDGLVTLSEHVGEQCGAIEKHNGEIQVAAHAISLQLQSIEQKLDKVLEKATSGDERTAGWQRRFYFALGLLAAGAAVLNYFGVSLAPLLKQVILQISKQ